MRQDKVKTGLFFGSFNPIHVGHLILAQYFTAFTDIEEVWFVVSPHNPLKDPSMLLEGHQRLAMVKEAVQGNPKIKECEIEFHLPQPSYTINTLRILRQKYPERHFILLMGADILSAFHEWKDYLSILEENEIRVYPRPGPWENPYEGHPHIQVVTAVPLIEMSSTFIREAIRQGKDIRYFVPESVYRNIRTNRFYEDE